MLQSELLRTLLFRTTHWPYLQEHIPQTSIETLSEVLISLQFDERIKNQMKDLIRREYGGIDNYEPASILLNIIMLQVGVWPRFFSTDLQLHGPISKYFKTKAIT